jgi:prepilin-type N-terminal cleavage/methylation domain-containing protein
MKNTPGQRADTRRERGFSLIELLIALVMTLVITGAVMSLLIEGNRAFQIQPEMTERQQNIRAGMDAIMRDVANAGAGLPPLAQVFTVGLNGAGTTAPSGTNRDILEMLTNSRGFDPAPACVPQGTAASGTTIRFGSLETHMDGTTRLASSFSAGMPVALISGNFYSLRTINAVTSGVAAGVPADQCTTAALPALTLNADPCAPPGNMGAGCQVSAVVFQDLVRYYIAQDPDSPDPVHPTPALWRQSTADGTQIVARGVEDMRVRYRSGGDVLAAANPLAAGEQDQLPLASPVNIAGALFLSSVTVEVQVELAARGSTVVENAHDVNPAMSTAGGADTTRAYRGHLVARGTPRAALTALAGDQRWR